MARNTLKRRKHALSLNKATEAPYRYLFTDTETVGSRDDNIGEQRIRLGSACYWERANDRHPERVEWHDYRTADEFWELVDSYSDDKKRLVLFAHNVGFDFQVLGAGAALRQRGWVVRKAIIDPPRFILKARRGSQSLWILDWYNYFRGSLAFAGRLVGVPKLPMPDAASPDSVWAVYCRNDVLVLFQAVKRYVEFLRRYDLGAFAYTLAGQSMNAYRHRFMVEPIYIHVNREAIDLERRGNYGGRTELFYQGNLPIGSYSYVDINSAYASVMHNSDFPTALVGVAPRVSVERLEALCREYQVIADVSLAAESPLYPIRWGPRLVFPTGTFNTTLATPELLLALGRGHVRSVGKCALYKRGPIFRQWVDEIYKLRADAIAAGDPLWDELLKRLMNSLYGKFGQQNDEWEIVGDEPGESDRIWTQYDLVKGTACVYRRLGGVVERQIGQREGYNSFVAIAAHVTSSTRVLLLKYIEQAGFSNAYYCDTDSLIVNEQGIERLSSELSTTLLGKLKLVATASNVVLNAPKNYIFGDIVRHKGRRNDAIDIGGGRYRQIQFVSLQGALRIGHNGGPLIRHIEKHDSFIYHKGTVLPGGRVEPLRMR